MGDHFLLYPSPPHWPCKCYQIAVKFPSGILKSSFIFVHSHLKIYKSTIYVVYLSFRM